MTGRPQATATTAAARSTRDAYRDALAELLAADERVFCLDSDTGLFSGIDFGDAKDRYVNLGISEQNLIGTAAGLAASGKLPYVTTMATFATARAMEAVKIDVAYNKLPVRIAGTHSGLAAGHLGPTHHALEDLAVMCTLPGVTVVVPADAWQAEQATRQTADLPGPVYLRLGKAATPGLRTVMPGGAQHASAAPGGAQRASAEPVTGEPPFAVGTAQKLRGGGDLVIVACGPYPVHAAASASDRLAAAGIGASVLNMHTLCPLDVAALLEAARRAAAVITVEEHWRHGGLGSLVAETLAEHAPARVARIGVPAMFAQSVGNQQELVERSGITDDHITETAAELLGCPAPPAAAPGSRPLSSVPQQREAT